MRACRVRRRSWPIASPIGTAAGSHADFTIVGARWRPAVRQPRRWRPSSARAPGRRRWSRPSIASPPAAAGIHIRLRHAVHRHPAGRLPLRSRGICRRGTLQIDGQRRDTSAHARSRSPPDCTTWRSRRTSRRWRSSRHPPAVERPRQRRAAKIDALLQAGADRSELPARHRDRRRSPRPTRAARHHPTPGSAAARSPARRTTPSPATSSTWRRSAAAPAPGAATGWKPIQTRDAFVDLDGTYAEKRPARRGRAGSVPTPRPRALTAPARSAAFLELAGSSDPLRVWLNGARADRGAAHRRLRAESSAIDLRAGAEPAGDRELRAARRRGTSSLRSPIHEARSSTDLELRRGVADQPASRWRRRAADRTCSWSTASPNWWPRRTPRRLYGDYRGGTRSWWAYANDQEPQVAVAHRRRSPRATARSMALDRLDLARERRRPSSSSTAAPVLVFPVGTAGRRRDLAARGYQAAFVSKGFYRR